jgi:hypothetical protein
MPVYDQLSVDIEVAAQVKEILASNPGMWSSRRDLYHDILRRGLLNLRTQLRGANRAEKTS